MTFTDNGDGTWTGDATDNGDGTLSSSDVINNGDGTLSPVLARDIDVTASPIFTDWQVMGITGYPLAPGPVNANNGYSAGAVLVDALATAPTFTGYSAGPIWIQE